MESAPRPTPARRGQTVTWRGRTLLSVIDPIAQAERAVSAAPLLDRTLYLVPSPLYGYGLSFLLAAMGEHSAVLCVEADPSLAAFSRAHMDAALLADPRLRFLESASPPLVCTFVRNTWRERAFRRVEVLRLGGGWQLEKAAYETLEAALRAELSVNWTNALTLTMLGRLYARNALRNLRHLDECPGIDSLSFGGRPVLVLGAGPSLDAFLDALTGSGGLPPGVETVCVDTALPALLSRGITPSLVVALEAQHWNLRDFVGTGGVDVPVAMDLSSLPAVAARFGTHTYFFATPWTPLSLFARLKNAGLLPPLLPPLGSVGLSAAALALRLGSGPVLTAGLDFSFTVDSYHCRASPGQSELLRRTNRFLPVTGAAAAFRPASTAALAKNGQSVRTDAAMSRYRALFEREFAREERLVDTSGTGLFLGLRPLTIPEALALLRASSASPSRPGAAQTKAVPRPALTAAAFAEREKRSLLLLRAILTGRAAGDERRLGALLDELDYLWAHFPDCAAQGGKRPPTSDLSFLKRVRVEIDPFLTSLSCGPGEREEAESMGAAAVPKDGKRAAWTHTDGCEGAYST